jgi:hypothetical protein
MASITIHKAIQNFRIRTPSTNCRNGNKRQLNTNMILGHSNRNCSGSGERGADIMAKKKSRVDDSYILFDVIYEDGSRSSRRKVAAAELTDSDGDDHAKTVIMAQDLEIAKKSGHHRGPIKSITRSPP